MKWILAVILACSLFLTANDYLSRPKVWNDLKGKFLCAFDSDGNPIPKESLVGMRYDPPRKVPQCPK